MHYALVVDPVLSEAIHGPYYLPGPVKLGLAACLEDLEQNPHVGMVVDPVLGTCRVHEQEYGSMHWRVIVFYDRDDEAGIIYVKDWRVESFPR